MHKLSSFIYQGRTVYPNKSPDSCEDCVAYASSNQVQCLMLRTNAGALFDRKIEWTCSGIIWAEGPEAQTQYILERLIS